MFGLNEALMSFIRRQVGLRTDAASSTGSLHAKVMDVKNAVNSASSTLSSTLQKPRGAIRGLGSGGENVTFLNVSGRGALKVLCYYSNRTSGSSSEVLITVDGIEFKAKARASGIGYSFFRIVFDDQSIESSYEYMEINLSFKTSLTIKNTGDTRTFYWIYEKE